MANNNLNQLFNKLYKVADAKNYKVAFDESSKKVEQEAKDNCPVDTGELKDSIQAETTITGFKVSAGAPYASYVEYGTINRAPEPYLVPAMRNNIDNTLNSVKKQIRRLY